MATVNTGKRAPLDNNLIETQPTKKSKRESSDKPLEAVSSGPVKSSTPEMDGPTRQAELSWTQDPRPSIKRAPTALRDDSDSEYEMFKVLRGHPSIRDPSELPIIAKHNDSGERKVLWAKMDTGADVNVIAAKTVDRLGLFSQITDSHINLGEIGGNAVEIDRKVTISFWAGRKNQFCEHVDFFIPKEVQDTDTDGIPDVVLGLPELRKRHMIMIDPDFANEPEDGLEVIARRACEEVEGEVPPIIFLGKKYPQVPKK